MKKKHIALSAAERTELEALSQKGKQSARVLRRALGLLELDRGKTLTAVAETLQVRIDTVSKWRDKYVAEGIKSIAEGARPGRPIGISGTQRAQITALACSVPPTGYGQWSLRLLADKIVELGYCETISHTQVATILKKTNSNRT
jgi:transposase